MRIAIAYVQSPDGRAALEAAVRETKAHDGELLVVHSKRPSTQAETRDPVDYDEELAHVSARLAKEGIRYRIDDLMQGDKPVDDLLRVARDENVDLLVIGLRRRTAVGKLVLGSTAQEILLKAECPVLAVKAAAAPSA